MPNSVIAGGVPGFLAAHAVAAVQRTQPDVPGVPEVKGSCSGAVATGLFTAESGTAAALLQRIKADGSQTIEAVTGSIDFGLATDVVFLVRIQ